MLYFKILVYLNSLFTLAFCFCLGGVVLFCLRQCLAMQANLDFTILLNVIIPSVATIHGIGLLFDSKYQHT